MAGKILRNPAQLIKPGLSRSKLCQLDTLNSFPAISVIEFGQGKPLCGLTMLILADGLAMYSQESLDSPCAAKARLSAWAYGLMKYQ